MGTLPCAYGLASAVCVATFAYARAAVVHFPGLQPFGVPVMWMTSWDYGLTECVGALVLPLVFPGRSLAVTTAEELLQLARGRLGDECATDKYLKRTWRRPGSEHRLRQV